MVGLVLLSGLSLGIVPSQGLAAPYTLTASTSSTADGWQAFDAFVDGGEPTHPEPRPQAQATPVFRDQALFIEAIEVLGNNKTRRQTVLARISVSIGDLVDEEAIEESRLRLLGTGFFRKVNFSLRRGSRRGRVLLLVEVEERNTILVDALYLGYSKAASTFGGVGLAERNFLGQGVTVGGGFVLGKDRRSLQLRSFAPSVFRTPLQLSASLIVLKGVEILDPESPESPNLFYRRFGGTFGVGFRVGVAQRISLIYRLESVRAERLANLDPAILRRAPSLQRDDSLLSTLTARFERDTRDDPFVPTGGNRVALTAEVGTALLGSTYEFSKYSLELSQAFLVLQEHSLEVHLFAGMVQGQTPFFNQFFVSDFAYFAWQRNSLARNAGLNFSASNDYDDLLASAGAIYSVPLFGGENLLYGLWVYGGVELSATASLDEAQEDVAGRGLQGSVPLSFDVGLKFDTVIGNFRLSASYILDLVF